jgi:hypothetical protein
MEKQMKKYVIAAIITAGLISLGILSFRPSKPSDTFYLRSCRTGRLIGPVPMKPGHLLPILDEQKYIVANPTKSELRIRKCLLGTSGYESQYIDCELADVVDTINQMLIQRLGDKAPPVWIEPVDTSLPPLITMNITKESAYDVLCNLAAKAQVHVLVEDSAVILSQRELREMSGKQVDSYVQ